MAGRIVDPDDAGSRSSTRGTPNKLSWSSGDPQGPEREAATTGRNGEGDRLSVTGPDATGDRLREAIVDAPEVRRDIIHLGSTVNDNPYPPGIYREWLDFTLQCACTRRPARIVVVGRVPHARGGPAT